MKNIFLTLILITSVPPAQAGDLGMAESAAPYLNWAVSARTIGMGQAHSALPSDAGTQWANPAALTKLSGPSAITTSGFMGLDRSFMYFGGAYPFKLNNQIFGEIPMGFAGSFTRLGIDNIEGRSDFGQPQASFGDTQYNIAFSYAVEFEKRIAVGITGKLLRHNIQDASSGGRSFDAGMLCPLPAYSWGQMNLSFVIRDFAGRLNWSVPDEPLQTTFEYSEAVRQKVVFGSAYQAPGQKWRLTLDAIKQHEANLRLHLGGEYDVHPLFQARLGFNAYDPTFGFGLHWKTNWMDIVLDYAFQYNLNNLHHPQWLTLGLKF